MLKKMIAVFAAVACLVGCRAQYEPEITYEKSDMAGYRFMDDEDHAYVDVTFEEALDTIENGTGVIYFGYTGCPWCQRAVPVLNEAAKAHAVKILYLDCSSVGSEENAENFEKLVDLCSEWLEKDEKGEPTFYIPYVVGVRKGKIVGAHDATVESFRIVDENSNLNEEQHEELLGYYNEILEKLR